MITFRYRTLFAFFAGVALAIVAAFAFVPWRANADPGDADATFVPITPCRLFDTRPAPDRVGLYGAFGVDDTKTIQARGTNGKCTIPTDAVGLSLNVTALGATTLTYLTIWPGGSRPIASSLNPSPGEPPTPNAVATNLSATGAFNVYNLAGSVEVLVDVNGYYTKSSLQQLNQRLMALESANPGPRIAVLEAAHPAVLAAHAESGNVAESIFGVGSSANVLSVTINAPAPGQLIMTGNIDVFGSTHDTYRCDLLVNGTFVGGSAVLGDVDYPGNGHTKDSDASCTTTVTLQVPAGSQTVQLRFSDRDTVELDDAALWAIWIRS